VKTGNVIAVSPSGDKYEFRTLSLTQAGPEVISVSTGGRRGTLTDEVVLTYHHNLLATKVTDVHGNWVAFDYEHEFDYEFLDQYQTVATRDYDSFRLKTIRGNDGRRVDLSYNGANNAGQTVPGGTVQTIDEGKTTTIASVTAHGRTWTYQYAQSGDANYVNVGSFRNLRRVVLPDNRDWILQLPIQHHRAHRGYNSYRCDVIDDNDPTPQTGAMHWVNDIYVEHPSGARVDFDFQVIKNPIWKLGALSVITNNNLCDNPDPEYTVSNAVIRKTIAAPSAPTAIWNFSYDQFASNVSGLGEVKRRLETRPDGTTVERMVRINNEGDIVRKTISGGGANFVEKTTYTKLVLFDEHDTIGVLDDHKRYKNPSLKRPTQVTITSDGDTFGTTTSYNSSLSSSSYSY
jgi:hypothetical protein